MNKYKIKQAPITYGVIGACIIIYLWTTVKYSFTMNALEGVAAGGFLPLAVLQEHEYYRLITANFIHFGLMHIMMNMISLMNIGPFLERIYGRNRYVLLIIGSALGTTGLPYLYYRLFSEPVSKFGLTVSGGASGIILGLVGGLVFLGWRYKGVYKQVSHSLLPSLLLVAAISLFVPSVSMSGHIGGFIGGFVTTAIISKFDPHSLWEPSFYRFLN